MDSEFIGSRKDTLGKITRALKLHSHLNLKYLLWAG